MITVHIPFVTTKAVHLNDMAENGRETFLCKLVMAVISDIVGTIFKV